MFPSISPKQSFPALESEVLAYWKVNNTFQKSIDSRPADNPYRFYDGPPFITGTPHYGSLLSSVVKDVVGRYWTMRGKRVDRVWGWDCHGLPIEEKVMKKLNLNSNKEIEERGVKEFIDGCYEYTQSTSAEWDWYIDKIGRWVDMDHAYRTMDQDYMESVMWVFSELWKKGLIYEGKRVSLYSWKLGTPISNFEVAMDDTYQEVNDPAITVKFKPDTRKATAVIVENDKGEILLGLHKKGYWMLPGGKAEKDESFEQCATRELLEETGIEYNFTEKDLCSFEHYDVIGGVIYDNRRYKIQLSNQNFTIGEPDKFSEWKFFSKDSLPENMFEPSRHSLENIENGVSQKNHPLSILAWTTTPWTIPANMALAVRNDIDYVLVHYQQQIVHEIKNRDANNFPGGAIPLSESINYNGEDFIVAKNRIDTIFNRKQDTYTIIREFKGSELVGLGYVPPFPEYYYARHAELDSASSNSSGDPETSSGGRSKNHKIYHADFITDTDGTGIGHEAPEFGDVDFQLAKREGIFISEAMDEAGKYTAQISTSEKTYEGLHYQEANTVNIERMKANNTLFKLEGITHRVPFCPRSGTPLMQKAQKSWFIDIQSQKEKLLKANEQINWFPEHLKEGRFKKGIETAPDWCISRTRYWGAPMPVWQNHDGSERVVVSSREEIYEANKVYGQLTKVIFVRHGESEANLAKIHGNIDTKLSEKGKIQAKELSEKLKKENIEAIYCSHFTRALNTIEDFSKEINLQINIDERLGERNAGSFEGKLFDAYAQEEYSKATEDHDYQYGNGESFNDLKKRGLECIREIIKNNPSKTVLIVGHSNIFSAILEEITGESYIKDASKKLPNGKIITVYMDIATGKQLNLHKPYIDSIKLQSPKTGEELTRIPEVLDVWMDSGSMPYAQMHYPFAGFEDNSIQKADTKEEKEACFEFFKKMWKEEFDMDFHNRPNRTYEEIQKDFLESQVHYICESDEIVSSIQISKLTNEEKYVPLGSTLLGRIGTRKEMRGKGYGTKLMKKALSDISKQGIGEIYLHSAIKNINFYKSFGFIQIQETPESKRNTSVVWMKKSLTKSDELQSLVFPADFIAEYVGQVRAWFYVMHVLGVLLDIKKLPHSRDKLGTGSAGTTSGTTTPPPVVGTPSKEGEYGTGGSIPLQYEGVARSAGVVAHSSIEGVDSAIAEDGVVSPAFTNVITTGVINGNDGRKMSKSFGNYPDPRMAIEKYGADPIRFYMLNSPLLSGGDMDFKEEGIVETIKGVMLPIWNTYSFFTTYANIDMWEHDDTEIWFARHAESTSNIAGKMSDGTDDPDLTTKGKEQAKNAGETLRSQGKKFDIIIHTSRVRTINTAHIIGDMIGFTGEYILDDGCTEQAAGEFSGMTHEELLTYHNQKTGQNIIFSKENIRRIYKEHGGENIDTFTARIIPAYESILQKYKGKKILIIAHAGSVRPIIDHYFGQGKEVSHFHITIQNADPFRLMTTPLVNPLDRWILSKLQVLIGQVHDAMEGYDISRGCRAIVDYMDHMTNWYVRLSRRRFWASGLTEDKKSGYETLYTVLIELSKLLAPYMPFLSEAIYKGLTDRSPLSKEGAEGNEAGDFAPGTTDKNPQSRVSRDSSFVKEPGDNSVHLQYITRPSRHLIDNELNRDMEICEHIVSLGLALRSRRNIRVRQPLKKVFLDTTLSEYYLDIIKNELNVKDVVCEILKNYTGKICKVDARKVAPKYGKDTQEIIYWGKEGQFTENLDSTTTINPEKREKGQSSSHNDGKSWIINKEDGEIMRTEVELPEWVRKELGGDLETIQGFNMVVGLDVEITEELKLEGYARDIVRLIQDMRKEAGYEVSDRISLSLSGEGSEAIIRDFSVYITRETLSTLVDQIDTPDTEKTLSDAGIVDITIQIRR